MLVLAVSRPFEDRPGGSLPICLQLHLACSRNETTRIRSSPGGFSAPHSNCRITDSLPNISCNDGFA